MPSIPASMLIEKVHGRYVFGRRVRILAEHLAPLLTEGAQVLDVGCGDGLLDSLLLHQRPDLRITGCDILVRPETRIPVLSFDGFTLPAEGKSFDTVMFVDVLHHTEDPMVLLREASRVARREIVIKDHTCNGLLAGPTLRFMDRVGNSRHGVALPYNYWPRHRWDEAFRKIGWVVRDWQSDLRLYPRPADWIFGRSLHFLAHIEPGATN